MFTGAGSRTLGWGLGILWGLQASASLRFLREVCSIRFLLTAVSLLSLFLAGERVICSRGPSPGCFEAKPATLSLISFSPLSPFRGSQFLTVPFRAFPPQTELLQASFPPLSPFHLRNLLPSLPFPSPETTPSFSSTLVGAPVPRPSFGKCESGRLLGLASWQAINLEVVGSPPGHWGGRQWRRLSP